MGIEDGPKMPIKQEESPGVEGSPIQDPALEAEKRKREIMGLFEIIQDIIQRAGTTGGELKKLLDDLQDYQQQKYGEVLKLLQEDNQEDNSEEALAFLKDSDERAKRARMTAAQIESLMDDVVKKTGELSGIIQPKEPKNIS
ncbi:MAG: hypothetical protein A2359_03040 [Candidatus Moranbacteria bacterium RIFOXYB1_FULL_43_19]|nr:MAG: hypothetical protein A2359_03040 [Candidatus Moranbacteria bacterium RIFOXYB1_FULL_43_19]OGI33654.1 MAG: hypothetical protein A2420_02300 [Candidatus Moranbacteria bacterium RIFOXYC1_FULL_44_13]OGI37197.1 MAG: hypothetical protein A2612_03905 [Candidatus Moranbacteria bacterium RIFOXYD1_FULL_44_12]